MLLAMLNLNIGTNKRRNLLYIIPPVCIKSESICKNIIEEGIFFPITYCSNELLASTSCQIVFEQIKFQFFWFPKENLHRLPLKLQHFIFCCNQLTSGNRYKHPSS